jgi:hypothetical protein
MEALGMNLEDIFIAIVDQSAENKKRYTKREKASAKTATEKNIAKQVIENTGKKNGGEFSALFGDDDNDNK